jgi:RNA polymerase sigma factor (sigma-70 family)
MGDERDGGVVTIPRLRKAHAMVRSWKAALARVRAALLRRGRTADDADDLVQEAWTRLAVYERETPVISPEAFLMRTALNLSIDAHRAHALHGEHLLVDELPLIDTAPSAEDTVLARERLARLGVCLGRLSERTRTVFLENRIEGMSYLQIAQRHGLSVSAVEKHIARATLLVTGCMEGW